MGDLHDKGLTLTLAPDGKKLMAVFAPKFSMDAEPMVVDERKLKAEILEQFPNLYLYTQVLLELVHKMQLAEAFEVPVAEVRDGEVSVVMDADKMSAYLGIVKPYGGAAIDIDHVLKALKAANVIYGIDNDAIERAVNAGEARNVVIAKGLQPVHGKDGYIEILVPKVVERGPQIDENGMVDFRNLGEIVVVREGQPLARRVPATQGGVGRNVMGQDVTPLVGKDVNFARGLKGVAPDEVDPNILKAAIVGQPVQVKDGVFVEPTYTVNQVDLSVGNINFEGTVNVIGDVQTGMSIKASGDIHIGGTVEASTSGAPALEAGGDIVVVGGVVGRVGLEDDGEHRTSLVKCKGSFTARYVQNVHIEAGGHINVSDTVIQSHLTACGEVTVGKVGVGNKGRIIGGHILGAVQVRAYTIGSPSYTRTIIEIGFSPEMQEHVRRLGVEQQEWEKKLDEANRLVGFARNNPDKIKADKLKTLELSQSEAKTKIKSLETELEVLKRQQKMSIGGRAIVDHAVYEGTEVVFGKQRFQVTGEKGYGVFHLDEDQIHFDEVQTK